MVDCTQQKDRFSWLALRRARTEHLHHFGKIGTGDVDMLMTSIEQEREKEVKGDRTEAPAQVMLNGPTEEPGTVGTGATNGDAKPPDLEIDGASSQGTSVSIGTKEAVSFKETTTSGANGMEMDG